MEKKIIIKSFRILHHKSVYDVQDNFTNTTCSDDHGDDEDG